MEQKTGSYGYRKSELQARLGRIEGQVRGISKMVEDEKYCIDILTQIAAVRSALERVGLGVLEDHVNGCVADAMSSKPEDSREYIDELLEVVERFIALRK
jgi:DNA-binding FrmR family transcriptional regulator